MPLRPSVVLAALLMLGASCGGTDGRVDLVEQAPARSTATDSADSAGVEPTEAGAETPAPADDAPKTLDEYLGVAAGLVRGAQGGGGIPGAGFDQAQFDEEQRLIQQEIQRCMQAQGFEYVPVEQTGGIRVFVASSFQGLSAEEFAATKGFGISTAFDELLEGDIDLEESTDPNADHLATLSEGEADAWQLALEGEPPQRDADGQLIDPETGEVIPAGPGRAGLVGGCTRDAQVEVRGDLTLLLELEDEFDDLEQRIDADPRIAELAREWADCMRGAGFAYETESEARAEIQGEFRPLVRSFFSGAAAGGAGAGQGAARPGGGGNILQSLAGLELSPEQDAELMALQQREIAIALASLECTGDSADEIETITARYEAEFVESNRSVLDQIAG